MKKKFMLTVILLSAIQMLFSQELLNDKKLYHDKSFHDFQFGCTVAITEMGPFPVFELATTHGFRLSKRFSLGAGLSTLNFVTLTPYGYARLNLRDWGGERRSVPYFSLKAGYLFYFEDLDAETAGIHVEPSFGFSFLSKRRPVSWAVFITANIFAGGVYPKAGVAFEF